MLQLKKIFNNQFIRFLFVGALNTVFGFLVFALFTYIGFHYSIAIIFSTLTGVLFNFKTIGILVFRSHDNRLIFKFFLVYLGVYILNLIGLRFMDAYHINHYLAQAILAPELAIISFLLMRRFVFKKSLGSNSD